MYYDYFLTEHTFQSHKIQKWCNSEVMISLEVPELIGFMLHEVPLIL